MPKLVAAGAAIVLCLAFIGAPATAQAPGPLTPEVLVQGAPIHGGNGLAIDQQGRLLVASVFGREIDVLDTASGEVIERIGPMVGGVDMGQPDDVAVAPDGSICWTDISGGFVDCLRTDGSVDRQQVALGVNPIAFMPDGRMFVGLAIISGDDLYELDPALIDPPRLVMEGAGDAPWPEQLNGFDFGPDGLLYAPRPFLGQIGRIDVDAPSPTFETLASGSPADGFVPSSVEFDSTGQLYASIQPTGEVVRVDIETGQLEPFAQLAPSLDNMVFGKDDVLYVSNSHDGRINAIDKDGTVRELSRPGIILPGGVAAVGGGEGGGDRLYVTDLWALAGYDGTSGELISTDLNSLLGGSITTPWTVAPDGDALIISSWMNNLVQVWDPKAHTEIASWPDFAVPVNAIRFGDDLVVAELGSGSVVRQTPDGKRSPIAQGLTVPSGLAASDGDLWVTDWATGTVWQIVTDGTDSMTQVATGLANPEGIAVDRDGSLLVVESGAGRLTRILASGETQVIADGLPMGAPAAPGSPPAWVFNGVAVGPSGAIYVTGDTTNVVWKLTEARAA